MRSFHLFCLYVLEYFEFVLNREEYTDFISNFMNQDKGTGISVNASMK